VVLVIYSHPSILEEHPFLLSGTLIFGVIPTIKKKKEPFEKVITNTSVGITTSLKHF